MLDRADCADFGCHNSIRLETKHFLNTLALTFISFSGRFVFAMQKHYLFFASDPLVNNCFAVVFFKYYFDNNNYLVNYKYLLNSDIQGVLHLTLKCRLHVYKNSLLPNFVTFDF